MSRKSQLLYSICICLSFVFSCKINASDKTKYLPTQFVADNKLILESFYDEYDQIRQSQSIQYRTDSTRNISDYVYQFNKGQLQQLDVKLTVIVEDSVINTYNYSNKYKYKYKYLVNDSTIHILIDRTTDTELYQSNPEITVSLNKDKLPYKYVYSDLLKGDTSIYTIKYDDRKRIVEIDQYSKYSSPVHIEIKRIWEVLDFDSPSYKSIYSDVDITYQQYIMMIDPLFVITTTQNSTRIKMTETIDGSDTSTSYFDLSYKYNDKDYPTQVTSQQYYNTPMSEDKGKGVVLDIIYQTIK